jgi:hypothetical protein
MYLGFWIGKSNITKKTCGNMFKRGFGNTHRASSLFGDQRLERELELLQFRAADSKVGAEGSTMAICVD